MVEQAQTMLEHWLQHLQTIKILMNAQLLADITRKISRLGAINLAAIEECKEIEIRKDELETQKSDLEEALVTLKKPLLILMKPVKQRYKKPMIK